MSTVCYCGQPDCPVTTWEHDACVANLRAERDALKKQVEARAIERERLAAALREAYDDGDSLAPAEFLRVLDERRERARAERDALKARVRELEAATHDLARDLLRRASERNVAMGERDALRAQVKELEAQTKEHQDRQALWDEDASFYLQTLRQADRIGELERERDEMAKAGRTVVKATDEMRQRWSEIEERLTEERAEAVAALRGLLREEWYIYEGNLEAAGHASVDDLNAARAVLAKYPEGK